MTPRRGFSGCGVITPEKIEMDCADILKHSEQAHTNTTMATTITYTKTQAETYFATLAERMMAKEITGEEAKALYSAKYPEVPTYLHEDEDPADCVHCFDCGKNRNGEKWVFEACECGEARTYKVTTDDNGEETYTLYCKKN